MYLAKSRGGLIVEEVSKTIEIINSRPLSILEQFQLFSWDLWEINPYEEQKKPTQLLNKTGF